MMSTFPAMPISDGPFGIQFPAFEGGFTPWDCHEPLFAFQQQETAFQLSNKPQEPVMSDSCSDQSKPKPTDSNPGSVQLNRNVNNSSPGSDEPIIDERKHRRMISNRLSARRSRMRKQKHLENMRNQVNRLRVGNRELVNRLRLVTQHCQLVRTDNDRLRSESAMLKQKLWAVHQVLLVREIQQFSPSAWPCNPITSINQQFTPPRPPCHT